MTTDLFQADENATPLNEEERRDLLLSLSTRAELNQVERLNINSARVWAMRQRVLSRDDLLSDLFARELHRKMFNQVWRWAGRFRTSEKNLGREIHRLTEGVHNAFADARVWTEFTTYPLAEIAVRLHHRLVQIHPWPNGNGRHARLMADIIVAARGGKELSWGAAGDLAAMNALRQRYIAAVQQADKGDFAPLLAFAQS